MKIRLWLSEHNGSLCNLKYVKKCWMKIQEILQKKWNFFIKALFSAQLPEINSGQAQKGLASRAPTNCRSGSACKSSFPLYTQQPQEEPCV